MLTLRLRNVLLATSMVLATVGIAAAGVLAGPSPASALGPDSGTSSAFGASVTLGSANLLAPTPSVTLGTSGAGSTLSEPSISLLGLLSSGTLNASTTSTNFSDANETIGASASVQSLTALSLLAPLAPLTVGVVSTSCTSSAGGSVGSTTVATLKVGGTTIALPSPIPANFGLTSNDLGALAGLVTVTLNAQTTQNRPGISGTSINVVGLQVTLLTGADDGAVIDVASSSCQATGADIEAVPTVANLSPNVGPAAGGTEVTIDGTGFTPASTVDFGGTAATNVTEVSPTQLTADSPADSVADNTTVSVSVSNSYGSGPATNGPANAYTYEVAPDATSIAPNTGPTTGGQSFTLTGTNFGPDSTVSIGANPATSVVVVSPSEITGVTPASSTPGLVNATVSDAAGIASTGYTYSTPAVSVTSVTPDAGSPAGGTAVTIDGTGFTGTVASGVTFGGTPVTSGFTVNGAGTIITATSPAGSVGTVNVLVNNGSATSPAVTQDEFTYDGVPAISTTGGPSGGLDPSYGPVSGLNTVTITGTGFGPDSTVAFGANAGTDVSVAPGGGSLSVVAPASTTGAGPVNVTVADAGGTSNSEPYQYIAVPTIASTGGVTPTSGPTAGGTEVTITGTGFTTDGTTTVTFGGDDASMVDVQSATSITALDPSGVPGAVPVVVTDAGGSTDPAGTFTYVGAPTVGLTGVSPAVGPATGGTRITLSGSGLTGTSAVSFGGTCSSSGASGGTAGTSVTPVSDSDATVVTPTHAAGSVLVCITSSGGTAQAAEPFTFEAAPAIAAGGLSPTVGPQGGGTAVTITGANFVPTDATTAVHFGASAATSVHVVSSTTITAVSPAAASPGPVTVSVSDIGGSATAAQPFTYVPGPVISGVSPTSGPQGGGKPIIIKGTGLCDVTSVLFGGRAGTDISVSPDCTTLTVTAPPGSGTVPVLVTTAGGSATAPEDFTYIQPGYWETAADGGVFAFGGAKFFGSVPGALAPGQSLNSPIVAMADTPDHGGYWLFAADGGVFSFGDASFYGSIPGVLAPGQKLNGPVVSAEATPDGRGYRMFASDGGVFDFGDAVYEGSLPGLKVTPSAPIEGATTYPFGQDANPDDAGYWLVAADGSVYGFANAPYLGTGRGVVTSSVVSLATTPDGAGYYIFSQNGSVAVLGDGVSGLGHPASLNKPIVFGQATSTGKGYWEFASDGGVFTYGDAPFEGSLGSLKLNQPITAGIAFGST